MRETRRSIFGESNTPRTDRVEEKHTYWYYGEIKTKGMVPVEFARELEKSNRELMHRLNKADPLSLHAYFGSPVISTVEE